MVDSLLYFNNHFNKIGLSFKEIYDKYYDTLVLFAQKYVIDLHSAEDLVQETYIKLWERKDNFLNENVIRAFLYKTVRNSCINYLEHLQVRKKFCEKIAPFIYSEEFFRQHVIEEEVSRIIAEAIKKLPKSAQKIFLMSLNGIKNNEIAEDLQISVNTVKTQKMRAKNILREKLKDLYTVFI